MNFDQARQLSFLVPWKTMECFSENCWCRIIVPVEPILYSHEESSDIEHEYVIVDAGALDQETAEYMARLHNEHLDRTLLKEDMDILNTGLRPLDSITITNTTLKDDYRVICRKEID